MFTVTYLQKDCNTYLYYLICGLYLVNRMSSSFASSGLMIVINPEKVYYYDEIARLKGRKK